MIARFLFFTGLASVALLTGARAAERVVEQKFAVQPGCQLEVATYRGSIEVDESDVPEVRVKVTLVSDLKDEREANRAFDALQLVMKADNNRVAITAQNPRFDRVRFVWNERDQIELAYIITVPRQCSVNLTTANGSILVGSLAGQMTARTDAGTITFRQIEGSITARTTMGDMVVSRCTGDIALTALRGNLRVGLIGGKGELKTSTGDIEVQTVKGSLHASAAAGEVSVGFARGFGDSRIEVAAGGILAKIDPTADCALNASSSWGKIESTLALAVDAGGNGKSKLVGRVNRGGPALLLRTSGGHVKIEPAPELGE